MTGVASPEVLNALITVSMVPLCMLLLARWPIDTHRRLAFGAPPSGALDFGAAP
jgi:hypothetical protein